MLDLECQRCFIIIHHPKSFSTFKGSLSKALWGVIKRGKPDRWFVTYGSFDQWLATIANHRHSTGSNGRPLSQKLYHWSMVMSKTRIYFLWHWNSKGEFARRPAESPWLTGQRAEVSYNDNILILNAADDNEMMSTQVVRKQDNLKMEGDFERPPVSAWQVRHKTCGSRLCLCFSKCICICVFVCVHLCLCEQQIDKQFFLERGAIGSCAQRG